MLERVRIRALRDAGHTLEEIAATVDVGKRSVQRILKGPTVQRPESAPSPRMELHVRPCADRLRVRRRAVPAKARQPEGIRRESRGLGERQLLQGSTLP